MTPPTYLDYNATTPVLPQVFDAMAPWLQNNFGNAGCSHFYGQAAKQAIATARSQVATLIGAQPNEIVFTSGGTEANNLATIGVLSQRHTRPHSLSAPSNIRRLHSLHRGSQPLDTR